MVLHAMVAHDLDLVVFGGLIQVANARSASNGLWLLRTDDCTWMRPVTQGEPPCARVGHAAEIRPLGGASAQIFVYGGFVPEASGEADGYMNDLTLLSLPQWEWSRPTWTLATKL